uniref:Uncharacterized protein n=1 Tax=Clastoptera arizonana TaxID=38151 RepID=A0A1B6DB48_9HEMI
MCDVVKSNFDSLYPQIEKSLKSAAFIAIDSEFSGLISNSKFKRSLFDSGKENYLKMKHGIEQFIIFQFGLSVYHFNRERNEYAADIYNFYIFPHSFGSVDHKFLCQSSSWEFLCRYNFDFNMVAYKGISYLNNQQEKIIRKEFQENSCILNDAENLQAKKIIQEECSKILEWCLTAKINDSTYVDLNGIDFRLEYFLHKEIRRRFKQVWTYSEVLKIRIVMLSEEEVSKLETTHGRKLEETLLRNLLGFSKIFKLLVDLKKPIIGHNCFLDFMIAYNQFYAPLPTSYDVFKKNIHFLFPHVFDTKFMSYEVRRILMKEDKKVWPGNSLVELYEYFRDSKPLVSHIPKIIINDGIKEPAVEKRVHHACWDAYMTGFCFIYLAHFKAVENLGRNAISRPLSRTEHLAGVALYENCVNLMRCNIPFINFSGKDPPSNRPKSLHVRRKDLKAVDIYEITELLSSFGSVDVKSDGQGGALVAAARNSVYFDILWFYKGNEEFRIVPYFPLAHSRVIKSVLWSGIAISSGLVLTYLLSILRTSS